MFIDETNDACCAQAGDNGKCDSALEAVQRGLAVSINHRRRSIGMPQEVLAQKAQLHRTYISDIERGARNISFKNLCRISWALGTDCASLVAAAEARAKMQQD